jgi:hypothetical protein
MDREQFQYYENSKYTNTRNKRRTLILDIKDGGTETSLGTGSEFNVTLFEPINIDKQSEIYLDNVSTFNSNIAQTPDTSAFVLKINEFNMNSNVASNDETSKAKVFNSLIIPNEHKNISNNHTSVIQKGKKFNYVCDINPKTIYSLSGKITDLSGSPMFHGSDTNHKFTYRLSGIDAGNLHTVITPKNNRFTVIQTNTSSQTVDGQFLEHHKKDTTELHFSTNIELINTGDFESGTGDITFITSGVGTSPVVSNTGSENPSLHLITNPGRFTAEFSIVSRE